VKLSTNRARGATAAALALAALSACAAPALAAGTLSDRIRADAARHGVDAGPLLEREVAIGGETVTLGELADGVSAGARVADDGPVEANAGDVTHFSFGFGPGVQRPYAVTESNVAPETPFVPLPLLSPAPEAIGSQVFLHYGGKVKQIEGEYQTGYHRAGGGLTNASTESGSNGDPVTLSGRSASTVADSSVDFTGTAIVLVNMRTCLFGYCIAAGAFLGDGVALFDNELRNPVDGSPLRTPQLP
jgi:hypothetical protein